MIGNLCEFSTVIKYCHIPQPENLDVPKQVERVISASTANSKEFLGLKIRSQIEEFKVQDGYWFIYSSKRENLYIVN